MAQEFITQNYLIIESNVVTNVCVWNGDTSIWTPPAGSIALVQATTPSMLWAEVFVDGKITDWVLQEFIGDGSIGFTWDTTTQVLTTNQPKPAIPSVSAQQPTTTGTAPA